MIDIYTDSEIQFSLGNYRFHVMNLVYERFERTIPLHAHGVGCYEIHYISEGYGRARIGEQYYEVTPGTIYVTGPHVQHSQTPYLENPMCEYCIYVKLETKGKAARSFGEDAAQVVKEFEKQTAWFGQDTQQIFTVVNGIFQASREKKIGYSVEVEAYLRLLLTKLVRNYSFSENQENMAASAVKYDRASLIIEEYFLYEYQNLSLEDLSQKLGLSPRQTERFLQSHYNKNFLQKKTEARMSAAAIQLTNTDKKVTEISENLGYASIEHFSTAFKKYYQLSPTQYRKRLKNQSKILQEETDYV